MRLVLNLVRTWRQIAADKWLYSRGIPEEAGVMTQVHNSSDEPISATPVVSTHTEPVSSLKSLSSDSLPKEQDITSSVKNTQGKIPFVILTRRFVIRTTVSVLITLALVSAMVWGYGHGAWALCYLIIGTWSLIFFGLTALVFKIFLFEQRRGLGSLLLLAKLLMLGILLVLCHYLSNYNPKGLSFASSTILGIITPIIVLSLRSLGSASAMMGSSVNPDRVTNNTDSTQKASNS